MTTETAKERGILFSADMVRALLREEDPKTMMRRVVTPQLVQAKDGMWDYEEKGRWYGALNPKTNEWNFADKCPYGKVGGRLWVRETLHITHPTAAYYAVDRVPVDMQGNRFEWRDVKGKWGNGVMVRPSIHMPRWASRISLGLTGVRVERVQDISPEDCVAEGIQPDMETHAGQYWRHDAINSFCELWNSINADRGYGWASNPWVWCLSFRRIEP